MKGGNYYEKHNIRNQSIKLDSKKDKRSWFAGYSLAKAENEIYNEYINENITKNEHDIISTFLRNITINYREERRESIYTNEWRKKTHICNVSKERFWDIKRRIKT